MRSPSCSFTVVGLARCALWALATGPALLPGVVSAQTTPEPGKAPQEQGKVKPPSWVLEPRIKVQHTVTSNARRDATAASDQLTEVSPGLRWIGNTARVKGFADYSLRGFHYARRTAPSGIEHNLNSRASIEAVEERVFMDVNGVVKMQSLSAFGAPVDGAPAHPNAVQTSSFGLSPYVRGRLGSVADYEARYSVQRTHTDSARRSNATLQDWLFRLDNQHSGQLLGWSVDATQEKADYSIGRSIDTTALRARLSYAVTPQLELAVLGGAESTNQISLVRESHSITGVGAQWHPSARTKLVFERENRYFGSAHNVLLEHRTARTVWRYTDKKGVSNGLGAPSASLGGLFDLLDGFYSATEPDPILRTQRVLAEIERLGLPADLQVPQDFLRSSSTLERVQQLSLALLGRRSMVTLAVMQSENQRLGQLGVNLGDDLDANGRIRQRGWSLLLAHLLTPNTAVQAAWIGQRNTGTVPGQETRVRSLAVGLSTLLAPRTNASLVLRRTLSDGSASPYNESAIVATLTHRF
ncbi:MAG: TIGR03016 family PEP-CTERM system-associated outer membrane protein [Simplicispira sp.]|nr:TIGR03016 family PEP-CTERM system-associated outer membrane protein [Simplicispira sp.]